MFDYEILRILWWAVLGVLLIGFAVMDGFDMGSLALLPFVAKTDNERRIVINTIGPVWEGNQVWLLLGAGAIFAAWPYLYAVAFSGFYFAMLIVLLTLILRPVGMKFRSKMPGIGWRAFWDWCLFAGGSVPPVIFGVAFGNALEGVPFSFDSSLRMTYSGSFFALLNPFALLCGILSLGMILLQGATWLAVKTEASVQRRARQTIVALAMGVPLLFAVGGIWSGGFIDGYHYASTINPEGPSNPLYKTVTRASGALMDNFSNYPIAWLVPALVILGAALALIGVARRRPIVSFIGSSLVIAGTVATAGVALFPFLLPSSTVPNASLTVWDASSSRTTLILMTLVTAVFLPIILVYTSWVYHVLRGPVTAQHVKDRGDSLY